MWVTKQTTTTYPSINEELVKYSEIEKCFKEAVRVELFKTNLGSITRPRIIQWYLENVYSNKMETLFVPERCQSLADSIYNDPTIRDFLWGVQKTFSIAISLRGIQMPEVKHKLVLGLCNRQSIEREGTSSNKDDDYKGFILSPKQPPGFYASEGIILSYLVSNQWLIAYILLMHFGPSIEEIHPRPDHKTDTKGN